MCLRAILESVGIKQLYLSLGSLASKSYTHTLYIVATLTLENIADIEEEVF